MSDKEPRKDTDTGNSVSPKSNLIPNGIQQNNIGKESTANTDIGNSVSPKSNQTEKNGQQTDSTDRDLSAEIETRNSVSPKSILMRGSRKRTDSYDKEPSSDGDTRNSVSPKSKLMGNFRHRTDSELSRQSFGSGSIKDRMSDKMSSPEREGRNAVSPRARLLRRQRSRQDSERSIGSGSIHRRLSYRRQSSLGLPHIDSFKSMIMESEEEIAITKEGVPFWTSKRFCLSIVCFVGFFCLYAQRVDLSIGIVCMIKANEQVEQTHDSNNASISLNSTYHDNMSAITQRYLFGNGSGLQDGGYSTDASIIKLERQCPRPLPGKSKSGDFTWDKPLQGLILGAFFWGYTALQIPGGWLAERFGPRKIISIGMCLVSVLTLLTPVCARVSPYMLIVCRVFIGIGEATMYPGAQVLWAKWSPPEERSRLVGFAFGGCQLGNALAFPIGSLLCAYGFDGGWPSVFYTLGLVSCIWCVVWMVFVRNSPDEMPRINEKEKKYILHSLHNDGEHHDNKHDPRPWKAILTSGPVWAILIANACGNYGAYMLLTQMPTYMKEVLKFDIKSNGIFSMIPYLFFWAFIIFAGIFADFLIAREIMTIGRTRKLCCCIGMIVPALFLVILGYMDCFQQTEAVVILTLSMAFCGFQFSSFFINHGDIAPKYAGTIFGVTNMGASVPGIIAPYVVSAVTQNKTQEEWRIAFYIAAGVYVLGAVAYIILAEGELQDWADPDKNLKMAAALELQEIKEESQDEHDQSNNIKL